MMGFCHVIATIVISLAVVVDLAALIVSDEIGKRVAYFIGLILSIFSAVYVWGMWWA